MIVEQQKRLSLFAKFWAPGKVKTRLAATLGDQQAAKIYRVFVETITTRLAKVADVRTIWFTPTDAERAFRELVDSDWQLQEQASGSLGTRMQAMFAHELSSPTKSAVLLGTDSPNVPIEVVELAFDHLKRTKLVLGPTDDGGYYLIGARGAPPPVFDRMPLSTPQLWEATLTRLNELGWREGTDYAVLPPWYDVDIEPDLQRLVADLGQSNLRCDSPLGCLLSSLTTL